MAQIEVVHALKPNFGTGTNPIYPNGYITVATVEIPDGIRPEDYLDKAFMLTNHIDREWWKNAGVTLIGAPKHRSTSVGDVCVLPDGRVFRCSVMGWTEIR